LQPVTSGTEFPYAQADKGNHGAKIQEKDGKAKGFRRIFFGGFQLFFSHTYCDLPEKVTLKKKLNPSHQG